MRFRTVWLRPAPLLSTRPTTATPIAGIELPNEIRVDGLDRHLVPIAAVVRKKRFVGIRVGKFHHAERRIGVDDLLEDPAPNRVVVHSR